MGRRKGLVAYYLQNRETDKWLTAVHQGWNILYLLMSEWLETLKHIYANQWCPELSCSPDFCPRLSCLCSDQSGLWFIAARASVTLSQAKSSKVTRGCQLELVILPQIPGQWTMKCNALGWQLSPFRLIYWEKSHCMHLILVIKIWLKLTNSDFSPSVWWKLSLVGLVATINLISFGCALKLNSEASWMEVKI